MEVRPGPSRRPSAYLPQGRGPRLWGFRPTWTHSRGLDVNWLVQRAGKAGGQIRGYCTFRSEACCLLSQIHNLTLISLSSYLHLCPLTPSSSVQPCKRAFLLLMPGVLISSPSNSALFCRCHCNHLCAEGSWEGPQKDQRSSTMFMTHY